jgi:uncharacterized protein involved in outer membrane biogenesis
MGWRGKKILLAAAGGVTLLVLAALVLVKFIDVNAYKPGIEEAASKVLGMDVEIAGAMGLVLFPGPGVTMDRVRVTHRGIYILVADRVKVGFRFLPLLRREIRIRELGLMRPVIDLRRRGGGRLDLERYVEKPARRARETLPAALLGVGKVSIARGVLFYSNPRSGSHIALDDIDMTLRNVSLRGEHAPDLLRDASFTGDLAIGRVTSEAFTATALKTGLKGGNGIIGFHPVTMTVFGGTGSGSVVVKTAEDSPFVRAECFLPKIRFEEVLEAFYQGEIMRGEGDFYADLSMKGESVEQMMKSMSGEISLKGGDLVLPHVDLDRFLAKREDEEGREFSLADAGAFLLVGPLGTVFAEGYDFAGAHGGAGGEGTVKRLISHWQLRNGVAEARDVALSTEGHRIAMKGALGFHDGRLEDAAAGRIDELTVALLDPSGCAVLRRKIGGTLRRPGTGGPEALSPVAGPASRPSGEAAEMTVGGECEVFYTGSVAPPR